MIKVYDVKDEDFVNYKVPSMFIQMGRCAYKCCREAGIPLDSCQNHQLHLMKKIAVNADDLYRRFISNPISKAIVLGGLDPIDAFDETLELVTCFRMNGCNSDIVIYTGRTEEEIPEQINNLKKFKNIVIKFGRYVPNQDKHHDDVLGVDLISDNQYGKRIS